MRESTHPFWNGGMDADKVEVTVAMRSYAFVSAHFLWMLVGTMIGGGRVNGCRLKGMEEKGRGGGRGGG